MVSVVWLIILGLIVAFFVILAITDRPFERFRRDDRDARKAADLSRAPEGGAASQQPSELQVGEEGELHQRDRFK